MEGARGRRLDTIEVVFPDNWDELAVSAGALKGLRKNKSAESLLRTLLRFCCSLSNDAQEHIVPASLGCQSEHLMDQLRLTDNVALYNPSRLSLS